MDRTGTITFRTWSQYALWRAEITGQLSDGHWENASPLGHWKFWCRLVPTVGPNVGLIIDPGAERFLKRVRYDIVSLMDLKWISAKKHDYVLRDRMLAYGRMGVVLDALDARAKAYPDLYSPVTDPCSYIFTAEDLPAGFHEFSMNSAPKIITWDIATMYYGLGAGYTKKTLRNDLKEIRAIMRLAQNPQKS